MTDQFNDIPPSTVGMDLAGLYLLARMGYWPGVSAGTLNALRFTLRDAPLDAAAESFRQLAGSGMPEAVVPFTRDALDIICAALWLSGGQLNPLRVEFEGEGVRVEAGFFRISGRLIEYIDTHQDTPNRATRLLPIAQVNALVQAMSRGPRWRSRLWVSGEDDEALRLMSDVAVACLKSTPHLRFTLSLVHPAADGRSSPTRVDLGQAHAAVREGDLALLNLPPEWLMELQAAAFSGAWLLIQHRSFRFFGPLPDLIEPGAGCEGWLHPSSLFEAAFGPSVAPSVEVPRALAQHLVATLPWAWVREPGEFIGLARAGGPPGDSSSPSNSPFGVEGDSDRASHCATAAMSSSHTPSPTPFPLRENRA